MSQADRPHQGVYKQGEQVIVVLPSDKVIIVQEILPQKVIQTRQQIVHQPSTLEKIQDKIHHLFQHKEKQTPIVITHTPIAPVINQPQVVVVVQKPTESTTTVIENPFKDLDFKTWWRDAKVAWEDFDSTAAYHMTQFKRQYVLPIGTIPVRSVCMAVSTGLTYAIFGRRNPNMFGRTRNLAANFVLNGVFWLPELFNPFLLRQNRI